MVVYNNSFLLIYYTGNNFPFVGDDRGDVAECILPICMVTKVEPPNPKLLDECRAQRANILLKCVRLYHALRDYVDRMHGGDISAVIHQKFKDGVEKYRYVNF